MTYVPINIPAYVSAYSGAIAGMAVPGWLIDPTAADYQKVTTIAGAFAQEFDTLWASAAVLNNLENAAITQVVSENFSKRGPGPLNEPAFATPANWAQTASACIALILESDVYFAGQGIDPGHPATAGLISFNGRATPAAVPTAGDYTSAQVSDASSAGGPTVFASLNTLFGLAGCAKTGTFVSGAFACAENNGTAATGAASHAEGQSGESRGAASHCEGFNGVAAGDHSHVEGSSCNTNAIAPSSHAEGTGCSTQGNAAHAEGRNTAANGDFSHAEGNGCRIDAINSHVEGLNCVVTNGTATACHAEGNGTGCTGPNSHAEGRNTSANNDGAHSEGVGTGASGLGAHSEGVSTSASHTGSHSEGFSNSCDADTAHVEGWGGNCLSSAVASHCEGYFCITTGHDSHAEGSQSNAWLDSDHAAAGGAFNFAGDAQYRRSVLKGQTNGSVPAQSVQLLQGNLAKQVVVRSSTVYGITVRAIAGNNGIGAAARDAAYYHFQLVVTVDSAGNVTISAPTDIVAPTIVGASFVGATLVYSTAGANNLTLTFTIAGGLSVNSHVVATVEYVEVTGN